MECAVENASQIMVLLDKKSHNKLLKTCIKPNHSCLKFVLNSVFFPTSPSVMDDKLWYGVSSLAGKMTKCCVTLWNWKDARHSKMLLRLLQFSLLFPCCKALSDVGVLFFFSFLKIGHGTV